MGAFAEQFVTSRQTLRFDKLSAIVEIVSGPVVACSKWASGSHDLGSRSQMENHGNTNPGPIPDEV